MNSDYRMMLRRNGQVDIVEVYYDDNGDIEGWIQTPIAISFENESELIVGLDKIKLALYKPILDEKTLEGRLGY